MGGLISLGAGELLRPSEPRVRAAEQGAERGTLEQEQRAGLDQLQGAVTSLAQELSEVRLDLAECLRRLDRAPAARAAPVLETSPQDEGRRPVASAGEPPWVSELRDQLELLWQIDQLSSQLDEVQEIELYVVELLQRAISQSTPIGTPVTLPEIPGELSIRSYLAALKESDLELAQLHSLWSTQDILQRYGNPDEVVDQGDYDEWIYRLGDEEQFDFHFVNGLCVEAH